MLAFKKLFDNLTAQIPQQEKCGAQKRGVEGKGQAEGDVFGNDVSQCEHTEAADTDPRCFLFANEVSDHIREYRTQKHCRKKPQSAVETLIGLGKAGDDIDCRINKGKNQPSFHELPQNKNNQAQALKEEVGDDQPAKLRFCIGREWLFSA